MRRAFCFSRSWSRYSLSLGRPRPCWPGGYGRISIGHLGLSHLLPLRNSFIFSRRQRRQSGPVSRAIGLVLSSCPLGPSDPATLGRAAAVVRLRGDVLDLTDLEAGRLQRADRRLPARTRALDEDVDPAHAVLLRLAARVLGRELRGERGRLAGALEPDVARGRPRDDVPQRIADGHDRVVERALDVGVPVGDVLLLLAPDLLDAGGRTSPGRHVWRLLLPSGLLLAGNGLLRPLAGPGVGLGALAVHGQAAAVPDALVAADLDLAADVLRHLAAQVALDLVVGVEPVAQLDQVLVAEVLHADVGRDPGLAQRLLRAGTADAVDVGERDLEPLLAGEVDAGKTCHVWATTFRLRRSLRGTVPPALEGPRPPTGGVRSGERLCALKLRAAGGACQPCRCLWRAVELQMTITRPLRRMTLHLSQIGLTLGFTLTELVPYL